MNLCFNPVDVILLILILLMTLAFLIVHRINIKKIQQMKDHLAQNYTQSIFDDTEENVT